MDFGKLIEDVLSFGLRLLILWMVYGISRAIASATKAPPWKVYSYGLAAFVFFALIAHVKYGTHVEDGDEIYGGGEVVEDFRPTDQQRHQHAATVFTFTFLAGMPGIYLGLKDRSTGKT